MEPLIQYARIEGTVTTSYRGLISRFKCSNEWTIANRESLTARTRQVIAKAIQE